MDALRSLLPFRRAPQPTGLAALAAALHAAAGSVAPPSALPWRELSAAALAGSALGWVRPIWFISVGYGVAMVLQSLAAAHLLTGSASAFIAPKALHGPGAAALALHAAHGGWLAAFLAARDAFLRTYAPKRAAIDARSSKLGPGPKAGMWAGVAALYVALAVPAWAVAAAPAPAAGSRAASLTAAGLALSAFGLWLEVTADIVKAVDKARNPAGFSRGCVYRLCRQPNLLGEALFWWGLACAAGPALAAAGSPVRALAAAGGLAAITAILVGDSAGKASNQARRMAGKAGWAAYAAATPVLWPLPRHGPGGGGGGGGGAGGSGGRGGSARGRAAASAPPAPPIAAGATPAPRRTPRRPTPSRRVRE